MAETNVFALPEGDMLENPIEAAHVAEQFEAVVAEGLSDGGMLETKEKVEGVEGYVPFAGSLMTTETVDDDITLEPMAATPSTNAKITWTMNDVGDGKHVDRIDYGDND